MLKRNLKANICRLCLNTKCDVDFEVVEVIKETLEIAWPKLNLEEGDQHLICNSCSVKLFAAFDFKSVCTDTEDTIFPYVNSQETPLVDLREIYLKEKGDIKSINILENQKICRLCFQSVEYGFVSVNEVDADIIDNYIPEVNFNATKDPVICKLCSDSLVTHGTFLSSCLAVQEENRKVCGDPAGDIEWCIKTKEIKIEGDCDRKVFGDPGEDRECCIKIEDIKIEDDWERNVFGDPDEDRECCIKIEDIKIEDDWESDPPTRLENIETIKNFDDRFSFQNKLVKSQWESESRSTSSPCPLKAQVRMFQCQKCPYKAHHREVFIRHWWTHKVPSGVKVYQCEICHYRVTEEEHFQRHQLRHEDSAETIGNFKGICNSKNIPVKKRKVTYTCNRCDYKTLRKYSLKRHCLTHVSLTPTYISSKTQCENESRDTSAPCLLEDQVLMYQCEECPYRTSYKEVFIRHWWTHEVPSHVKVYQCEICHYRITQKNHFRSHQLKHQDGGIVEKYTCDKCDFQTRYKCSLVTHQLLHKKEKLENVKCHTGDDGEPLYKCNVCKYLTKNRRQLLVHRCYQVSSTKQLKFKCHMCAYQSARKGSVTRHQLTHNLEAKTYKCDICVFQTIRKTNLIRHQLCHRKKCKSEDVRLLQVQFQNQK